MSTNGHGNGAKTRRRESGVTANASSAVGAGPRRRPTLATLLITLGVIAALNLIVIAFTVASRESDGPAIPAIIEQLIPARNGLIPRQGAVGADLDDQYTGVLIIDGNEIPEDQLSRIAPQGRVTFQPGAGKDIELFSPGRHSIKVVYWKQVDTRDTAHEFGWQFTVD